MLSIKWSSSIITGSKVWKNRTAPFVSREICLSFCSLQSLPDSGPADDSFRSDVDEEELEKKRFKARLPEKVYRHIVKKEFLPPADKKHFIKKNLCKIYALYGEQSGLNPGIAWPTREELVDVLEHDRMFHPPLREMLDNVAAAEQEKQRERLEYEAEVDKNMKKLETHKREYYAKIAKKKAEAEAGKRKQRQLIEEISELLGYDVDPKDPKYQEALEMKRKEEKKAQKTKKQQESYEKMLSKLAGIAASSKKTESESQVESVNTTEDENNEKSSK